MAAAIKDNIPEDSEKESLDKKPKKKTDKKDSAKDPKKPKGRVNTYIINSGDDLDDIENEEVREFIDKIISSQLDPNTAVEVPTQRQRVLNEDMIKARLSEFLNTYLIIGYDVNGERSLIKHVKNDVQEDALIELLRHTFFKVLGNGSGQ